MWQQESCDQRYSVKLLLPCCLVLRYLIGFGLSAVIMHMPEQVAMPESLAGEFVWQGKQFPLRPGTQTLKIP
jgi:hypothetical protein